MHIKDCRSKKSFVRRKFLSKLLRIFIKNLIEISLLVFIKKKFVDVAEENVTWNYKHRFFSHLIHFLLHQLSSLSHLFCINHIYHLLMFQKLVNVLEDIWTMVEQSFVDTLWMQGIRCTIQFGTKLHKL